MWAHHARHWLANIYVTLAVTYSPFFQPDKAFSMVNVAVVFHSGWVARLLSPKPSLVASRKSRAPSSS